jgi:tellurite resistance protein TehA-like permease
MNTAPQIADILIHIGMLIFVIAIAFLVVYIAFLPSVIAYRRNMRDRTAVLLINLFFGASGVGWLVALVWACNGYADPIPEKVSFAIVEEKSIWGVLGGITRAIITVLFIAFVAYMVYLFVTVEDKAEIQEPSSSFVSLFKGDEPNKKKPSPFLELFK